MLSGGELRASGRDRIDGVCGFRYQNTHPRVIMEHLGHAEIRTTMNLYSHVAPVLQREAAQQMDALLSRATKRRK